MPTPAGHTRAIQASRVIGTSVENRNAQTMGSVEDLILDKMSDRIMFAVVSFGGFLGIGEKYHALPWAKLDFNPDKNAYVVDIERAVLERAPTYELKDFTADDGAIAAATTSYYKN